MSKTVFSKIIDREIPAHIIWEDESACAFLDTRPITPGHTLLVPINPDPPYLFDLESSAYIALWERARWLSGHLRKAMDCKRVGIMVEGFMVPHVHIHLVPINNGHDLNPASAQPVGRDQLGQYHERIVQHIRKRNQGCQYT